MASEKKLRKTAKKSHPGRDGKFLKQKGKGIKGVSFFTSSDRMVNNHTVLW